MSIYQNNQMCERLNLNSSTIYIIQPAGVTSLYDWTKSQRIHWQILGKKRELMNWARQLQSRRSCGQLVDEERDNLTICAASYAIIVSLMQQGRLADTTWDGKFVIQIKSDWPEMGQMWDFKRSLSVHFGSNVLKLTLKSSRFVPFKVLKSAKIKILELRKRSNAKIRRKIRTCCWTFQALRNLTKDQFQLFHWYSTPFTQFFI